MLTRFAAALLLCAASFVVSLAQEQAAPAAAQPPKDRVIGWKPDDPNCDRIVIDGRSYRIIKNDGIVVAAYITEARDFYAADVAVSNNTERRILVDPQMTLMEIWKKGAPADKSEILHPITAEKIAAKIQQRAALANALRSFGASMSQTSQTVQTTGSGNVSVFGSGGYANGTYTGTSTSTVTSPDVAAQRRADAQNAETSAQAQAQTTGIRMAGMRANTLFPKHYIQGDVYFPRKKFQTGDFVLKVENVYYVFGISGQQK